MFLLLFSSCFVYISLFTDRCGEREPPCASQDHPKDPGAEEDVLQQQGGVPGQPPGEGDPWETRLDPD